MINEQQLEQLCIDWLREGGYAYLFGPDIAHDGDSPERTNYSQVVLSNRLIESITRINPQIPQNALEEAAHILTKPDHPSLIQSNRAFHRLLMEGVKVPFNKGDEKKTDHVQLIELAHKLKSYW